MYPGAGPRPASLQYPINLLVRNRLFPEILSDPSWTVVACMDVYDDFFSYGGGVYHHVTGNKEGGHCILVVGYSELKQMPGSCKNSWGTVWGEAGFFNIAYQECNIDSVLAPFFGAEGIVTPA